VSYLYRQTSGATATNVFERLKTIFTKKSESAVSIAVRRRIAGETLTKLATVAAVLIMTAVMTTTATVIVTSATRLNLPFVA